MLPAPMVATASISDWHCHASACMQHAVKRWEDEACLRAFRSRISPARGCSRALLSPIRMMCE